MSLKTAKVISLAEAAALVPFGATLIAGGFGMTGNPVNLLHALAETDTRDLCFVGNNVGEPGLAGGRLLRNGQLRKAIGSFFTSNREAVEAFQCGKLEVELLPQGTLGEALRAAGAGIGGFFTPTGASTPLAEGKESRTIDGKEMIFIEPLHGDIAFVRARKADTAGNLQYSMTENNFNQAAATAAKIVVAEVEEIVPVGEIAPEFVHTPCCYVDYLVQAEITPEQLGTSASVSQSEKKVSEARMNMARAALAELRRGDIVNLGIGIPTLVADLISAEDGIILHSENGMLGVGPEPSSGGAMDYPVNAGKIPVTALPGASYFDSSDSFGMIRGGHIDVAIIGGLQVDASANLANWAVPGKPLLGVGGAMDLASGARRLIVTMQHCDREGRSKVVECCDLPLTAERVVDVLITDRAVFHFVEQGLHLVKLMPGFTLDAVTASTEAPFTVATEVLAQSQTDGSEAG